MRRTILAAVLASLLALSGCGSSEEETAKTSIAEYFLDQDAEQQLFDLQEEEADCIAEDMVDGVGVEKLQEYGFITEDGSVDEDADVGNVEQGDAETIADAMLDCADAMQSVKDGMMQAMGQQSAETQKCVDEALTEDLVRDLLVATFTGESAQAGEDLAASLEACAKPRS